MTDGDYLVSLLFIQNGSNSQVSLPTLFSAGSPSSLAKLQVPPRNLRRRPGAGAADPADPRHRLALRPTCTQNAGTARPPRARAPNPRPLRRARAPSRPLTLSQTLTPRPGPRASAAVSCGTAGPALCGRPCEGSRGPHL